MPQPKRTKRCDTCKYRRIQCDEIRPRCGPCIKGKRRCVVAEETLIFQNWTVEITTPWCPSISQSPPQEFPLPSLIPSPQNGNHLAVELENLSLSHIWEHFLRLQLPSSRPENGRPDAFASSLWQSLAQMDSSSPSLQNALAAVASARIGQIEGNPSLCEAASRLYGTAVSNLRGEICDGRGRTSIDVIATVLTLAAYEFYQDSSSGFGYISHAQGAGRLIESLGPSHFNLGTPHKLFLNFRELGVIHAIMGRKATFLSTPEWCTQPFITHQKSDFDRLLDIAVFIPGLYEQSYLLKPSSDSLAYILRLDLIDRYWAIYDRLSQWYENYTAATSPPNCSPLYNTHPWLPFPSQFHFSNVETARCLIFYWTFNCCLNSGITWEHRTLFGRGSDYKTCPSCAHSIQRACHCNPLPSHLDSPPSLPPLNEALMRPPPTLEMAFANADKIAMSIPYLLQKDLKGIGAEICVWPLRVIHEVYRFRNEEPKVRWTLEVFRELEGWGISWSRSLLGMQFPDYWSQQQRLMFGGGVDGNERNGSQSPTIGERVPVAELLSFTVV